MMDELQRNSENNLFSSSNCYKIHMDSLFT